MAEINHRELAVALFNKTWEYLDITRSEAEDHQMVLTAHASCYHWSQCGTALEQARGEWQISRVHSVLKQGAIALWHAQRSLTLCLENQIADFDLAFAYEAIARAYQCLGQHSDRDDALRSALKAAENIADEDDKTYTLSEIKSIDVD